MISVCNFLTCNTCNCVALGGSDGIGFETALELAHRGARVIIASRQQFKGQDAVRCITGTLSCNNSKRCAVAIP